jgi:hypothetical protein
MIDRQRPGSPEDGAAVVVVASVNVDLVLDQPCKASPA